MKNKLAAYAFLPALSLSLIGTGVASAHGMFGSATPEEIATRQQQMFQHEADILGISVDDIKAAWAAGKSPQELAKEKGISQADIEARLKAAAEQKMKQQLQTLVDKGVITQAQADQRFATMRDRVGKGKGMGGKGFHKAFRL